MTDMPVTIKMPPKSRSFLADALKPTAAVKQRMWDSIDKALREVATPSNDVESIRMTSPVAYKVGQTFEFWINGKFTELVVTRAKRIAKGRYDVSAKRAD